MRPLRVLVLTTAFPRFEGDLFGSFIFGLCGALTEGGVELDVLAPSDAETTATEQTAHGVPIRRFNYFWPRRWQTLCYGDGLPVNVRRSPWLIGQAPFLLAGFFRSGLHAARNCDVIHAHWSVAGLSAIWLRSVVKRPVVVTFHGADVYTRAVREFGLIVARSADAVICNSTFTKRCLNHRVTRDRLSIIPFGVNVERVGTPECRLNFRGKLGISKDTIVVSYLGRLVSRKGVIFLVEAFRRLAPAAYNVHLLIGGRGPEEVALRSLVKRQNLEEFVTFCGYVPGHEIGAFYAASDIFVLPSVVDSSGDTEGLGVVLLEAMANGLPVVATRVGGIPDVVVEGQTGFLVEQRNPVQLAQRMAVLCQDPGLRASIGSAGKERVEKAFSWRSIAERTLQVYNSVLACQRSE
ncbi:glycosyltransferase family 4 protein [Acidobacteria bacterium AH-259-D05]|nr:glycosyltransferase family 4 protein [Acidobacteria bacterium AH-259-D05]